MKRLVLVAVVFLCSTSVGYAMQAKSGLLHFLERDRPLTQLEMGTEISHFQYREPNFMKDKGMLYGGFITYAYRTKANQKVEGFKDLFSEKSTLNLFKIDARFSAGDVDYESEGTGTLDDIRDYIFEIRGTTGYDFPVFDASQVTPYVGIGYRYLNDDSGGKTTSTGAAGYEREANYIYIPLGLETTTNLDAGWVFGIMLEYDFFVYGLQKSHLGDAITGLSTIENDQKKGYGLRGAIKLMKKTENVDFFVEPYVRYWDIDKSETAPVTYNGVAVGFGLEPQNNSLEVGGRIGVHF